MLFRSKNKNERDVWFRDLKSRLKCEKCGVKDFECLDFHHRDPATKEFAITEAVRMGYAQDRIVAEIDKCDVLCTNCHIRQHTGKGCNHRSHVARNISWLNEYKSVASCVSCGEADCEVLCFHHKDGEEKQHK